MVNMRAKKGRPNRMNLAVRAKQLGTSPSNLSRVLNGKRVSHELSLRFRQLVESEQKTEKEKS
jgi:hypothetical protein